MSNQLPFISYDQFINAPEQPILVQRLDAPTISASFSFAADKWYLYDLLRPHERDYFALISYSSVAVWLKDDLKRFIAQLWLYECCSLGVIKTSLRALLFLSDLFPHFSGRVIDLTPFHAGEVKAALNKKKYRHGYNATIRQVINHFADFIQTQHPECLTFRFHLDEGSCSTDDGQQMTSKSSPDLLTVANLLNVCIQDTLAYEEAVLSSLGLYSRQLLLRRAILAQALILTICTGRRPNEICQFLLAAHIETVERKHGPDANQHTTFLRFWDQKERNAFIDVPCPEAFAELALHAIAKAKELTAPLRQHFPLWSKYLFLLPDTDDEMAAPITVKAMNAYLNGKPQQPRSGLFRRYSISTSCHLSFNSFRHWRATILHQQGFTIEQIKEDLGHQRLDSSLNYIHFSTEQHPSFTTNETLKNKLRTLAPPTQFLNETLNQRKTLSCLRRGQLPLPTRYGYRLVSLDSPPNPLDLIGYEGIESILGQTDSALATDDALVCLYEDREILTTAVEFFAEHKIYEQWSHHCQSLLAITNKKIAISQNKR